MQKVLAVTKDGGDGSVSSFDGDASGRHFCSVIEI
jgi:hypothetical protein